MDLKHAFIMGQTPVQVSSAVLRKILSHWRRWNMVKPAAYIFWSSEPINTPTALAALLGRLFLSVGWENDPELEII